jgi:hypothetical protein
MADESHLSNDSCVTTVVFVWHLDDELFHALTFIKSGSQASQAEACCDTAAKLLCLSGCLKLALELYLDNVAFAL